jgi:signal transduction histidine kinase
MLKQKLLMTLRWSAISIAGAVVADYVANVVVLHQPEAYEPLVTLIIASVISLPVTFALVNIHLDLRATRDELAAARDAALLANRTKTQFFANMSHELRTPLNAILGFSELLGLDVFASKRAEYAHLIHNAGGHLLSLVNDLLDLSKIEAGKMEFRFEPLDFAAVVDDCIETVVQRARQRDLRLERSVQADLPWVNADHRALKQILLNLLTNAIKFSYPGGAVEVFACLTPDRELVFGVRDEGVGIPEDEQAHVFERYGQARERIEGADRGTGLGLPIVRGLVEAHGGSVVLESRAKAGTLVVVNFPAVRVEPAPAVALAS